MPSAWRSTRALLAARHRFVAPLIPAMTSPGEVSFSSGLLTARWAAGEKTLLLLANLSDAAKAKPALAWGTPIWGDTPPRDAAALVGLCGNQFKCVIPGCE